MVAPPFFLLLMGTVEAGIIFFAQSSLQNAVNDVARMVRTGQTGCFSTDANGNCMAITQEQFRTQICNEVSVLLQDCNGSSLQFDVNAYPAGFSAVSSSSPLDVNNNLPNLTNFNLGGSCQVVLVRAFYTWPVFTPMLKFFLTNMAGNYHLLATAAVFRNEPYGTSTAGC